MENSSFDSEANFEVSFLLASKAKIKYAASSGRISYIGTRMYDLIKTTILSFV